MAYREAVNPPVVQELPHRCPLGLQLSLFGRRCRGSCAERAQPGPELLEFVVLGGQGRDSELVTLLELVQLGVSSGELRSEPLILIPLPSDPGLAQVG